MSDIEGNNLLYKLTQFHCGVVIDPFNLTENLYAPHQSTEYLADLSTYPVVVGHNFRGYDLLALSKLFRYVYSGFCVDTLILSRLIDPERKLHALGDWGRRLKFFKGDYATKFKERLGSAYRPGMEWLEFNPDMMNYCVQDVRLNAVLFLHMIVRLGWCEWFGTTKEECIRLERAIREGDLKRV